MPKKLPDNLESYLVELAYWTSRPKVTIAQAAQRVGISRSKAQEILSWGRDLGLLETTVFADRLPQHVLAGRVVDAYTNQGLRHVTVLPGPGDDALLRDRPDYLTFLRRQLGTLAARFVEKLPLDQGSVIALSGGRTLMEFAQAFNPPERQLVLRPLSAGGRWRPVVHADAAAVLQVLLWRLGYRAFDEPAKRIRVLCPEAHPGLIEKTREQPDVAALFSEDNRPEVVVTAMGWRRYVTLNDDEAPGPHGLTSSFVALTADSLYFRQHASEIRKDPGILLRPLKDGEYRRANAALFTANVVADINRYAIAKHPVTGEYSVVPGFAEATSLAVHPNTLSRWRRAGTRSVVVLGGARHVHALKAALAIGAFDCAVIDTPLAVQLLDPEDRPELYRDVPLVSEPDEVEQPPGQ